MSRNVLVAGSLYEEGETETQRFALFTASCTALSILTSGVVSLPTLPTPTAVSPAKVETSWQ